MSRQLKIWSTAVVLLLAAVVIAWFAYNGGTYTITITQKEAQERIDTALVRRAATGPQKIEVQSVLVSFANSEIQIDASISGQVRSRVIHADVHGTGMPSYRSGAFYFHPTSPIRFSNVTVEKKENTSPFFKKTRELLKQKAEEFAQKHNLDELERTFKTEFAEWASATAQKILTERLERHPIYVLKNTKGFAIRAVLEKVEMVGEDLKVTLSLTQLGYTIFVAIALLALTILLIVLVCSNPDAVIVIALFGAM